MNKNIALLATLFALAASSCTSGKTELTIGSVGDTMAFDKTTLEVKAGAEVSLTLKNNGTNAAMLHNWILTNPGKDQEVMVASLTAGPAMDYAADSPDVLAKTKLLKPGESTTITFKAPATPGDYPYICAFPGHYPLMKGILKVL